MLDPGYRVLKGGMVNNSNSRKIKEEKGRSKRSGRRLGVGGRRKTDMAPALMKLLD